MTARLIAREVIEEAQALEIDALSALATAVAAAPDLVAPLAA